ALKIQGIQLRIVFHISKTDNGFTATMDSPDQKVKGIPVTTTTFENSKLKLEITNLGFEYNGEFEGNAIKGTLKQNGQVFPLNLSRGETESQTLKRPQEPTKPYPYYSEDISFQNKKANVTLAGTLTLPKKEGIYPAVILITGSGAQNRNEEVFGHKPFLVIADYLTRNGIAVLRYDDRGFAQSTGNFSTSTTFDFASDVESAISYLKTRKEINARKIGLIGHSEGGIIAPIVAVAEPKDVDFIVLLAGSGLRGDKLMLLQKEKLEQAIHIDEQQIAKGQKIFRGAYDIILQSDAADSNLKNKVGTYFKQSFGDKVPEEQISTITNQIVNPWSIKFLKYNPIPTLEKVKCPVLALGGEKDLQVPPEENLIAIKTALEKGGNKNVTTKLFPNLNHLFQDCKTGLPNEYSEIEETFSPAALDEITKWIKKQVD
ncbi:MAG TPA: alpha/beta hydrolase, partial [Bacteroidia bacterium]|nr:alpha/beta hydrolase [Bacteroidia bacterium]